MVTRKIVLDIETNFKEASRDTADFADQLTSVGKTLENSAEPIHQLRRGIEDITESMFIFGESGNALVSEIEKIRDPARRLELSLQANNRTAALTDGIFNRASDALQQMRVEAALLFGGVERLDQSLDALKTGFGLVAGAATAAGGAILGGVVKGVEAFIEKDAKAGAAVKRLKDGFEELLFTIGNAVAGGDNFAKLLDKLTAEMGKLTEEADANREAIFAFSKDAVIGLTYVVEWLGKTVVGIYGFFQAIVDSLQELFRQGFLGFINLAEGLAGVLGIELGDHHYALKLTVETDTSAFRETERIAELLESIGAGADKVRSFFGESGDTTPVASAKTRRKVGGGGGGGGKAGDEITFTEDEALATLFELQDEAGSPGAITGSAIFASWSSGLDATTEAADGLTAALQGVGQAGEAVGAGIDQFAQSTAQSLVGLAEATAGIFASAFGDGATDTKKLFGEVLKATGAWAVSTGNILIAAGAGWSAIPGFQGSAGAVVAGATLVGLGIAAQAGGAALGRSASSSGGGGFAQARTPTASPGRSGAEQLAAEQSTIIISLDGMKVGQALVRPLGRLMGSGHLRADVLT